MRRSGRLISPYPSQPSLDLAIELAAPNRNGAADSLAERIREQDVRVVLGDLIGDDIDKVDVAPVDRPVNEPVELACAGFPPSWFRGFRRKLRRRRARAYNARVGGDGHIHGWFSFDCPGRKLFWSWWRESFDPGGA
jgi:hypothetical protein